jgi:hypothetical protein
MSQNDFTQCGFIRDGSAPSLSPLNGWFWPFAANGTDYDPAVFLPAPDAIYFPIGPVSISLEDFDRLYWKIKQLEVTWSAADGVGGGGGTFTVEKYFYSGIIAPGQQSDEEFELVAGNIPYIRTDDPAPTAALRRECRFVGVTDPDNGLIVYFNNSQVSQGNTTAELSFYLELEDAGISMQTGTAVGMFGLAPVDATFLGYEFEIYSLNPVVSGSIVIDVPASDGYYSYNGRFNTNTGAPI